VKGKNILSVTIYPIKIFTFEVGILHDADEIVNINN
jgi:hypothetical protein